MITEQKQAKINQLNKEIAESEKKSDILWKEKLILDAMKEDDRLSLAPNNWQIVSSQKLREMEFPETRFLVEKLIPQAGITIISGPPSAAKSWLMLEIARCVSSREVDFLGKFKTQLGRVLYIDEEGSLEELKRRNNLLCGDEPSLTDFMALQNLKIDNKEQRTEIIKYVSDGRYFLVILDALRSFHSGDENDSNASQKIIDGLRDFTRKGLTLLIAHHNRKENFMASGDASQMMRGSTVWLAGIDSLLAVEGLKKTDKLIELTICQPKLRQGQNVQPFKVNLIENENKIKLNWLGEMQDDDTKLGRAKETILNILSDGKEQYQAEITVKLIALYFQERTINRAFKEIKDEQLVNIRKGEKNRTYLTKKGSIASEYCQA